MQALQLLNDGKLDDALAAAIEFVKANPAEAGGREIFVEMLCLAGDLERADKQAETIALQDSSPNVSVSLLRQLIRAETSRRECWQQGRLPEFLGEAEDSDRKRLEALMQLRHGDKTRAQELLTEIGTSRPAVAGKCDGTAFADLCDMDDSLAGCLELLTSTGKYYWVPMQRVRHMEFSPVQRPRDLLWRQCKISVADGPDGVVYIPVLYAATDQTVDGPQRLGHATDWNEIAPEVYQGVGQRMFYVDDNEVGIMEISQIQIDSE